MRILKLAAIFALIGFSAHAQSAEEFPVGGVSTAEQPKEVVRETHDDWEIRCTTVNNSCFLYQLLLNDEGTPVADSALSNCPLAAKRLPVQPLLLHLAHY